MFAPRLLPQHLGFSHSLCLCTRYCYQETVGFSIFSRLILAQKYFLIISGWLSILLMYGCFLFFSLKEAFIIELCPAFCSWRSHTLLNPHFGINLWPDYPYILLLFFISWTNKTSFLMLKHHPRRPFCCYIVLSFLENQFPLD